MPDPTIRLATLSTVMLSREDLQAACAPLIIESKRVAINEERKEAIARVADALSSITNPSGVQAIACKETAERSDAHVPAIEAARRDERERIVSALEEEADSTPCGEDAVVVRDCARLVRADFDYEIAERLAEAEGEGME